MARIKQHPARPSWPVTGNYLPTPTSIEGISWMKPWEPPFFPKRMPVHQQQTEMRTLTPDTLPVGIAGIAWMKMWEPPYFHGYPAQLQQTTLQTLTSEVLPPIVTDMWYKMWEPPYFPRKVKVELQQTSMWGPTNQVIPVNPSGTPWMKPWEPPYFPLKTKHWLQQTQQSAALTPATLPVGIRGIAWRVQWPDPEQKRAKIFLMPTEARSYARFSAGISGMSWFYQFDQPKQKKVPVYQMPTEFMNMQFRWQGTLQFYIFGGAR